MVCSGDIEDKLTHTPHAPTVHEFTQEEINELQIRLLKWFDQYRRKLPWRGDTEPFSSDQQTRTKTALSQKTSILTPFKSIGCVEDCKPDFSVTPKIEKNYIEPYGVWVSEVMLQQTRVSTVIEYYQRWMTRFPSLQALASASVDDVHQIWSGLGYYRRARMLLEGAKFVIEEFSGKIPASVEKLMKIPGIGAYTAGAISSIAFGVITPAVDGNVIRVLSRIRGIAAPANDRKLNKLVSKLASQCVPKKRSGDFNQALMELGACVCTHKTIPSCIACPINTICFAYRCTPHTVLQNKQSESCDVCCDESTMAIPVTDVRRYPTAKMRKVPRAEERLAVVVQRLEESDAQFFFTKRDETGLLAKQWDFLGDDKLDSKIHELITAYLPRCNVKKMHSIGKIVHIFSHIHMTLHIHHIIVNCDSANKDVNGGRWMTADEAKKIGLTKMVSKVLHSVLARDDDEYETKRSLRSKVSQLETADTKRQKSIRSFFTAKKV